MLVLMRRCGESIILSVGLFKVNLLIEEIIPNKLATLKVGNDNAYMSPKSSFPIYIGKYTTNISVDSIGTNQVSLSFEAPEEVSILREELV